MLTYGWNQKTSLGVRMSKRDIKEKRWAKRHSASQPVKTGSRFGEQPLRFIEQVRRFGDGRWQYRDAALVRRFSLRRRGVCLAQAEWRDC